MWRQITDQLVLVLKRDERVRALVTTLESKVLEGVLTPGSAADTILNHFLSSDGKRTTTNDDDDDRS